MALGKLEGQLLSNRYQIESLIGQGGMSAVYKGYDPNLRRTVAVKIIHPHLSNNPDFVTRFQEEAAAVARLRHPNIVQVFDFNADGDLYYMIMEFLPGETLQGRLARLNKTGRHLPMQNALQFGAEICEAAEYAHQRGMVHRDIKPANVMLSVDGKAILMDFGIARIVGGSQHTATGAVLGTAMYMAPEQVQGLQADARADIYSLGVTLFEMFSGKPPFEADSAMTLMMMHLNDPVPDLRDLRPDAPDAVLQVIETAMAKNRGDRYPSAQAMAEALRGILAQGGLPAEARPKTQPRPAPAAPAPGETVIEAPPPAQPALTPAKPAAPRQPAGTLIEPAPQAAPAAPRRDAGRTYVEPAPAAQPAARAAQPAAFPTSPDQAAYPVKARRSPWLGFVLILLLIGVLGGGGLFAYQQFFAGSPPPAAAAPTETQPAPAAALADTPTTAPSATFTPEPSSTATLQPTETPTVTPTPTLAPVVIGGADKIAWLQGGNIWAANLDGSQLAQLTTDGSAKTYLRWLPDGSGLSYISGKCILSVSLEGAAGQIACFNNSQYLESFEVSPDGTQVVISVDRQLYLVPFDLAALAGVSSHDGLAAMAGCEAFAPYKRNFAHLARWSSDGSKWAALVLGVLADGRRGDVVQVFSVQRCIPDPLVQVQFPQPHFSFKEYDKNPALESIAWDGGALFSFHGNTRNDGFGDLHIFNIETFKALLSVNPIGGKCCYRDPVFSPDGSHLLFAYQDYLQGAASVTRLYYIPFGSIGTGQTYGPLPLPEITDAREKPQPVLRRAGGP